MAAINHDVISAKYGTMLVKTESTYGTDPTPAADTNAICVWDVTLKKSQIVGEPDCLKAHADANHIVPAGAYWDISFKAPLTGGGEVTGGDVREPAISPILQASRFTATDNTSSWVYTPSTVGRTGATIYLYLSSVYDSTEGNLYKIYGFQGHCKLMLDPATGYGVWEVEGRGIFVAPASATPITADYYELAPPTCVGLTATIDSTAYTIRRFELDNVVEIGTGEQIGASGNYGYGYFQALRGHTIINMTVDALIEASGATSYQFYTKQQAATEISLDIGAIGSVTGNTWTIDVPKAVIKEITHGESNSGLVTYDLVMVAKLNSSGNDSFSITVA